MVAGKQTCGRGEADAPVSRTVRDALGLRGTRAGRGRGQDRSATLAGHRSPSTRATSTPRPPAGSLSRSTLHPGTPSAVAGRPISSGPAASADAWCLAARSASSKRRPSSGDITAVGASGAFAPVGERGASGEHAVGEEGGLLEASAPSLEGVAAAAAAGARLVSVCCASNGDEVPRGK